MGGLFNTEKELAELQNEIGGQLQDLQCLQVSSHVYTPYTCTFMSITAKNTRDRKTRVSSFKPLHLTEHFGAKYVKKYVFNKIHKTQLRGQVERMGLWKCTLEQSIEVCGGAKRRQRLKAMTMQRTHCM